VIDCIAADGHAPSRMLSVFWDAKIGGAGELSGGGPYARKKNAQIKE
jgi:hypothetical protein